MEFKDLQYFKKLVESKSYHATANFFKVSQPAITAMVKRLEKELGTQLIYKVNNRAKMTITPAGMVVYRQADKLLKIEQSIKVEALRANQKNFRLGYSELAGNAWLSSVITKLNHGDLLAFVETHEENSHLLEQHLREGKYDAIVFSKLNDEQFKGIKVMNLTKYHYYLIVPSNSPLAQKSEIDLFELREYPFIIRHKRFLSRSALEQTFAKIGFKPKRKLIVDSIGATTKLISQGMGVGYLMDIAVENVPGVKAIPLIPSQQVDCYACLGVREDFVPNEIQSKCLEILKDF